MAAALHMAVQQVCLAVAMVRLQVMVHQATDRRAMALQVLLTMAPPAHQTITEAWALLQAHATAAITTAAAATAGTVPATE